jgi:hypothetical protein
VRDASAYPAARLLMQRVADALGFQLDASATDELYAFRPHTQTSRRCKKGVL